jgi:uncharacterized OsmC-like protein
MSEPGKINGVDVAQARAVKQRFTENPDSARRTKTLKAEWVGRYRSRVQDPDTGLYIHMNGEKDLNAMQMFLATLASCDVDLVARHASLLGIEIESLSVEATGSFDMQAYGGVEGAPAPGYEGVEYTVHLTAPGATPEQIETLRRRCEVGSPVGDSFARAIPLKLHFRVNS